MKSLGGIAPFGYKWHNGQLVIDEKESEIRRLIYELFLKYRRKKTVARVLNDLGYRTRTSSRFSDTTIDRLLRDRTAVGERVVKGQKIEIDPIISDELWDRVNSLLDGVKPPKQTNALFSGIAFCICGGKMVVPSNTPKYICRDCRRKILSEDLEQILHSQLERFKGSEIEDIYDHWGDLTQKQKRIVIEQICDRIVIAGDTIHVRFAYSPQVPKTPSEGQRNSYGNETPETAKETQGGLPSIREPLLSEEEAAAFLGISKMTVMRKRNAGEIGHFRVGFRVLYSKEKHLIPYLDSCEKI